MRKGTTVGKKAGGMTDGETVCQKEEHQAYLTARCLDLLYVSMRLQKNGMTPGCSVAASLLEVAC